MGIRIIQLGLGAMGRSMVNVLLQKKGVKVVGAIDQSVELQGQDLGKVLGTNQKLNVKVSNDLQSVMADRETDIVLQATSSFARDIFPDIVKAVKGGLNVISIAEEMTYVEAQEPEIARRVDALAKKHKVTVLGTGINPGFVLDTLIITLTGVCITIDSINATRINDLSAFGTTVMKSQGVGATPEGFEEGVDRGSIVGHIGFPQSIRMISDALTLRIDEIKETREAIISKTHRKTPYIKIEPGMVAGCRHTAYGLRDKKVLITLEHPQQIHPQAEGVETGDYIEIKGNPDINMYIKPEIPGGIGTAAIVVNMIPIVLNAQPGLKTMVDLPIPRAFLEDIRDIRGLDFDKASRGKQ